MNLAVALGEHQTEIRRKTAVQLIEKVLGQILPPVVEPVDMALVQAKHRAHVVLRQLRSLIGANGDAALRDFTPLALDLVAPVAAEAV